MDNQIPDGSVIITPNEIFRELRDTHDEVKSLGAQMQSLTQNVSGRVDRLEAQAKEYDARLDALERWKWKIAGGALVMGAGASWAADYLLR